MNDEPEKIQLIHPEGKNLPRIDKKKYDIIKKGILSVLRTNGEMKPMKMLAAVAEHLEGQVDGSITWYAEGIKLDMQSKGELIHDKKKGLLWLPLEP